MFPAPGGLRLSGEGRNLPLPVTGTPGPSAPMTPGHRLRWVSLRYPEVTIPHAALSAYGSLTLSVHDPYGYVSWKLFKKKSICKYKSSPVESSGRNGLWEFASQEPRRLVAGLTPTSSLRATQARTRPLPQAVCKGVIKRKVLMLRNSM